MRSMPRPPAALLYGLVALLMLSCRGQARPLSPYHWDQRTHSRPPAPAPVPLAEAPPLSLTASDGTGLKLTTMGVRAVVEDPLALTELELSFENPQSYTLEGRFEILLPQGAQVTRFATLVDGQWREAEVVEKYYARQVYEASVHDQQDPALLERDAGNRFSARVFPIEAYGRVHVLLSYAEQLTDPDEPYRLSTKGLPWLEDLDVRVVVADPSSSTPWIEQRHLRGQQPTRDIVIPRPAPRSGGVRKDERVVARVEPLAGISPGQLQPLGRLTVLVDTSASRAFEHDATISMLGRLLHSLSRHSGTAQLEIIAFDQQIVPIYDGPLASVGSTTLATLHARRPLGASNLQAALDSLAEGERDRVLLVTDGLISAGAESNAELRRSLARLAEAGVERLDVLRVGSVRDDQRLHRLVTGPLSSAGVLLNAKDEPDRIAQQMLRPTLDGLRIDVPGARWWHPRTVQGLQPGDHILVHAELPEGRPMSVQVSGPIHAEQVIELREVDSPLVDHAWMHGRIENLIDRIASLQDRLKVNQLRSLAVSLSVRHRIFNDFTAFLVLETEADYARFGLDRRGLGDILVAGPAGVVVHSRAVTAAPTPDESEGPPPSDPIEVAPPMPEYPDSAKEEFSLDLRRERRGQNTRGRRRGRLRERRDSWADATRGAKSPDAQASPRPSPAATSTSLPAAPPPPPVSEPLPAPPATQAPVTQSTTVGRTITMEEFRNIPVGNSTSRDFTQVVESSATASHDSAGIILAGTTGSESAYSIEGANANSPAFGLDMSGSFGGGPGPARVLMHQINVRGSGLHRGITREIVRDQHDAIERCYFRTLDDDPGVRGRLRVELRIDPSGHVTSVYAIRRLGLRSAALLHCLDKALRTATYPVEGDAPARVMTTLIFQAGDGAPGYYQDDEPTTPQPPSAPTLPTLPEIELALADGRIRDARSMAWSWREAAPSDVLALVALGQVAEFTGKLELAARAYGSILDLYPSRADMRRYAAGRLEGLDEPALTLAIDAYRKARAQRPDHPTSHRNLAFALVRQGHPREAFAVLEEGLEHQYPADRFASVHRVLRDDLGIVASAWRRQQPTDGPRIDARLEAHGATLATGPSLRFVLTWETDANDVDLHVQDTEGNDAYHEQPTLPAGGELYADVDNGYGPECFAVSGPAASLPYRVQVHYYDRGPMGYGMGKVQVVHHDGEGEIVVRDRSFVITEDRAVADLGVVSPIEPPTTAPGHTGHSGGQYRAPRVSRVH